MTNKILTKSVDDVKPQSSNTGAQNTETLIDWLTCVIPAGDGLDMIFDLFGRADWVETDGAVGGYTTMLRRGGIRIMTGHKNHTVNLSITGSGCRELEAASLVTEGGILSGEGYTWQELLGYVSEVGEVTRLDVAIDVFDGSITHMKFEEAALSGCIVSRARKGRDVSGDINLKTGEREQGGTFYIGRRVSDTFTRVYDKAAEMRSKGKEYEGTWTRLELELKRKRAHLMAQYLSVAGLRAVVRVLRSHMDVRENNGDLNRSRWPVAIWWDNFCGGVEKLALTIKPEIRTLEQVKQSLLKQYGPTLSMLMEWWDGDMSKLATFAAASRVRYRTKHRLMLAAAGVGKKVVEKEEGSWLVDMVLSIREAVNRPKPVEGWIY
jgi:hypothetical protein